MKRYSFCALFLDTLYSYSCMILYAILSTMYCTLFSIIYNCKRFIDITRNVHKYRRKIQEEIWKIQEKSRKKTRKNLENPEKSPPSPWHALANHKNIIKAPFYENSMVGCENCKRSHAFFIARAVGI
jgi:hypothetical protein